MSTQANALFDVSPWGTQPQQSELVQTVNDVVKDLEDRGLLTPILRVQAATARRLAQIAGHEKSAIAAVNAAAQLQALILQMEEQTRGTGIGELPPEVQALVDAFAVPGGNEQ